MKEQSTMKTTPQPTTPIKPKTLRIKSAIRAGSGHEMAKNVIGN